MRHPGERERDFQRLHPLHVRHEGPARRDDRRPGQHDRLWLRPRRPAYEPPRRRRANPCLGLQRCRQHEDPDEPDRHDPGHADDHLDVRPGWAPRLPGLPRRGRRHPDDDLHLRRRRDAHRRGRRVELDHDRGRPARPADVGHRGRRHRGHHDLRLQLQRPDPDRRLGRLCHGGRPLRPPHLAHRPDPRDPLHLGLRGGRSADDRRCPERQRHELQLRPPRPDDGQDDRGPGGLQLLVQPGRQPAHRGVDDQR